MALLTATTIFTAPAFAQDQAPKWEGYIEGEAKIGNERDLGEALVFRFGRMRARCCSQISEAASIMPIAKNSISVSAKVHEHA